jgi:hypothetical protein
VSNMIRDKNFTMYGFVSVLLLASFLMTVPANQYQKIFAQTEGEEPADSQGNVTEETQENATDTEIPPFETENATFVPRPESEREAPPVPPNAIKGDELPNETLVKDPDSEPLSISNRTEILEVLPANSTKIIEHVDDDLKNSSGEGLLPPNILERIISGEGQGNDTILDISSPEELDEIKNFSESTTNQTTEEALEEGEPVISNVTNATTTEAPSEEQEEAEDGEVTNMTNATSAVEANITNATGGEEQEEEEEDGEEQEQAQEEVTNMTNATGAVEANLTNATSGEEQEQEEAEDGGQQAQTAEEEDTEAEDGEIEAITNATNVTAGLAPGGLLNTTNLTSMLNATDSEEENDDSEGDGEDE